MSTSLCRLKIGVRSSWSSTLLVKKRKKCFIECYFLALPSSPSKINNWYMCAKIKYLTPAAKPLCIHICTTVITVVLSWVQSLYDLTFLLNFLRMTFLTIEYYRHYLSLTGHWKLTFCVLCIIFLSIERLTKSLHISMEI